MILLKKESKLSVFLEKFTISPWFMAIIGALTLCGHFLAIDLYAYVILGSLLILVTLFVEDGRPLLVFCCTLWPVVSVKNGATGFGSYDYHYYSSKEMTTMLIVMCSIAFCAFLIKFIKVKGFQRLAKQRSLLTTGIIIFAIGLLLNGIDVYSWSSELIANGYGATWGVNNIVMGGLEVFLWFIMFYYFRATLKWDKNTVKLLFQAVLTGAIVILIELVARVIEQGKAGELFFRGTYVIDRRALALGWGIANNVAACFVVALPGTMYLATTQKRGWIYLLISCALCAAIVITQCRAAILVGMLVMLFCLGVMCVKAVNKKTVRIMTAVLLGVLLAFVLLFKDFFIEAFPRLFANEVNSSSRFEIWKSGFDKFAQAPVFGKGFADDVIRLVDASETTVFHNLYHNEIVQIITACGLVGFAGFVLFKAQIFKVIVKKMTLNRLFLGTTMLAIDMLSMFDSNIFFPFEAVFFSACLAVAHFDFDDKHNRRLQTVEEASTPQPKDVGETVPVTDEII